ncbi:MAG TPA: class I SAM-dependent methyltransferase [Balneolales bacterium]|nr:class I SAM-dependent methyltransferase [Balneolales bacterium]
MSEYKKQLERQYHQENLVQKILTSLQNHQINIDNLNPDELKALDEFHIKGRRGTLELAELAGVEKDMRILDVGCGIGGPARTLAKKYDCKVIGLDIIEEYCDVAETLTEITGLQDRVSFIHGDALDLPFENATFDMIWMQHISMNIPDKRLLFSEIRRVLRNGGKLALFEVCSGDQSKPYYPVPWADDSTISYMLTTYEFRQLIRKLGFKEYKWLDVSDSSLEWFMRQRRRFKKKKQQIPDTPGIHLLMGEQTPVKMENVIRNLEEDRIRVIQAVFSK